MLKKLLISSLILFSGDVFSSWDGSSRGLVSLVQITAADNYGFRVNLDGSPALCGNSNTWAYLNGSDSNYDTYVSLLTAAKFAKNEVTIFTKMQSNGYCKIGHVYVH